MTVDIILLVAVQDQESSSVINFLFDYYGIELLKVMIIYSCVAKCETVL